MHLVEVLASAMLFSSSSLASLQLWQDAAQVSQSLQIRDQELEQSNLLRLRIHAHLRNQFTSEMPCPTAHGLLEAAELGLADEPESKFDVVTVDGVQALQVKWKSFSGSRFDHTYLFTPDGFGACQ